DVALMIPRVALATAFRITARAIPAHGGADGQRHDLLAVTIRPAALPPALDLSEWRHENGVGLGIAQAAGNGAKDDDGEILLPLVIASEAFPFQHHPGAPEGEAFRHLRDSSNYLIPKDFLAGLRLPALFL